MTATAPILPYSQSTTPPRFARFLLRTLGWPFFTAQIFLTLLLLWLARIPGSLDPLFYGVFLGGPLLLLWILRLLLRTVLWRIYKPTDSHFLRGLIPFALAFIAPILLTILLVCDAPFRLAFLYSQSALEREALAAKSVAASASMPTSIYLPSKKSVGLFTASTITYDPSLDVVKFTFQDAGFLDAQGVAYSTRSLPRHIDNESYIPFQGPWYHYLQSF